MAFPTASPPCFSNLHHHTGRYSFRHGGAIIIARATRLYHLRPFAKWRSFRGAVMHGPGSPLGGPLVSQTCAAGRRTLSDRTD